MGLTASQPFPASRTAPLTLGLQIGRSTVLFPFKVALSSAGCSLPSLPKVAKVLFVLQSSKDSVSTVVASIDKAMTFLPCSGDLARAGTGTLGIQHLSE